MVTTRLKVKWWQALSFLFKIWVNGRIYTLWSSSLHHLSQQSDEVSLLGFVRHWSYMMLVLMFFKSVCLTNWTGSWGRHLTTCVCFPYTTEAANNTLEMGTQKSKASGDVQVTQEWQEETDPSTSKYHHHTDTEVHVSGFCSNRVVDSKWKLLNDDLHPA